MEEPHPKFDDKHICVKCSGLNEIVIKDTLNDGSVISECETECTKCGHKDYWGYGWYESRSAQ